MRLEKKIFLVVVAILLILFVGVSLSKERKEIKRCEITRVVPYEQCYGKKGNRWCSTQYRHEKFWRECTEADLYGTTKIFVPDIKPTKEKDDDDVEDLLFLWFLL